MYEIQTTASFIRTAKKFFKRHPELKNRFESIVTILIINPLDQSLKLHPLQGEHQGLHSIRLTYKYRITLIFKISKKEITLLDISSHDDVY